MMYINVHIKIQIYALSKAESHYVDLRRTLCIEINTHYAYINITVNVIKCNDGLD